MGATMNDEMIDLARRAVACDGWRWMRVWRCCLLSRRCELSDRDNKRDR